MSRDDKQVIFKYWGNFFDQDSEPVKLGITKKYVFKRNWFTVSFLITNLEEYRKSCRFVTNLSLSLPNLNSENIVISPISSKTNFANDSVIKMEKIQLVSLLEKSKATNFQMDFNCATDLWMKSEKMKGWDSSYSINLYPDFGFKLYPKESIDLTMTLRVSKHR